MTRKTTPKDARKFAPPPGVDSEFEEQFGKVLEAIEAAGNPEGITPEVARETLARRMVEYGGKAYAVGDLFTPPDEDDDSNALPEPIELRVPSRATEVYWYEEPNQAKFIEHHILARRALGDQMVGGLIITGPPGEGKTMGIPHLIDRMNRERGLDLRLLIMHCPTVTDPQKWFGRREIDATGSHYVTSDFIESVQRGDVILLDEVKRLHPVIHNPIMSLLAGDESVTLSDLNITIRRHPECVFLSTTNDGAQFGGNHRMDYAMEERWPFRVERTPPPDDERIKILTQNTGCDPDAASVLVDIAARTRSMFLTGDLRAAISTRTLVAAAWLVAAGYTERESLEYTALGLYDGDSNGVVGEKSERMQVMGIIEGRTGRR